MAYEEDAIRKNPFVFKLTDAVVNDSVSRVALTEEQLTTWMGFIKNDSTYCKYYDEFVVLLETGMRVSEFCGLTKKDLDFKIEEFVWITSLCGKVAAHIMWRIRKPPVDADFYR